MTSRVWPPLVLGQELPAWIRFRDFALTLLAWALFLWWVRGALALLWDWVSVPVFQLTRHSAPDWSNIWARLAPFLAFAALLAAWLVAWSVVRRRTLRQQHDSAQPAPLEPSEHAERFHLAASDVARLAERKVAIVLFEGDGRIVPTQPFSASTAKSN